MRILVVDDSAIARKFLIKSIPKLENVEVEIKECSNGLEAVNTYPDYNPDIVFLDLTMPVMDGMEALDNIKKIDAHANVYVLTADIQKKYTREDTCTRCK